MDAEDAPGVLAGGAGFAPEARRVRRVADRQLGRVEDLVAVEVGDRDFDVGIRYRSSRVTTYIWSSLSGIWPVPVADTALTTAGGQTSVMPFSRVWTSRNQLIRAR